MLAASPLELLGGELDHRPELALLLTLTDEAEAEVGAPMLQRWLRTSGPHGRPSELLLARDFAAFETALSTLRQRGFTVRRRG